jgi:hypothetical protein
METANVFQKKVVIIESNKTFMVHDLSKLFLYDFERKICLFYLNNLSNENRMLEAAFKF